jgi:hypothetical protein
VKAQTIQQPKYYAAFRLICQAFFPAGKRAEKPRFFSELRYVK